MKIMPFPGRKWWFWIWNRSFSTRKWSF